MIQGDNHLDRAGAPRRSPAVLAKGLSVTESALLSLVGLIYQSADDPKHWDAFLKALNPVIKGQTTVLVTESFATRTAKVSAAVEVDTSYWGDYENHYARVNPYYLGAAPHLMQEGRVMPGQLACSASNFERSEYYNDYLSKLNLFHAFGAIIERRGDTVSVLTSLRPRDQGAWDSELQPIFDVLLPHMRRALQWNRQSLVHEARARESETLLNATGYAAILLDRRGRIVSMTTEAERTLAKRDPLYAENGMLRTVDRQQAAALEQLIDRGTAVALGESSDRLVGLSLHRDLGRPPLQVVALPLPRAEGSPATRFPGAPSQAIIAILLRPEGTVARLDEQLLRDLVGLTRAESEVAAALALGLDVKGIAVHLGITVGTTRWHLKQMFARTGARSQADLTRILLSSLAGVRDTQA